MELDFSQLNTYFQPFQVDELNAEGFPDYMIYSLIQKASETNTIILSRLPDLLVPA